MLLVVYLTTLAPSITFWDAAEFAAAARGLGIPHPPGTPLWVLVGRVVSFAAPAGRAAQATNLLSALCTAAAAAIAAGVVARWTASGAMGAAAAIAAGGMSTVWLNATETEVYAAALLLAMLTLCAAERAGRDGSARWVVLVAYLVALAPALHLIALLAAPTAILLAARGEERGPSWRVAAALSLVLLVAASVGRGEPLVALAALTALAALAALRSSAAGDGARRRWAAVPPGAILAVVLATSALAVLSVRAAHDPPLNQGDPSTLARLVDVVARRQYDVAPIVPRQAPLWIQTANLLQYADWQVALGVSPGVEPSIPRTLLAVGWLALGVLGGAALRRRDRRGWQAVLLLLLTGGIGALLYLNLKAGPSIGWGFLPDTAPHEARERDYFFVFAFWAWGLLAGVGAVDLAARLRLPAAAGLPVAALPIALNWAAVDRTREPEASITRTFAAALLRSAPERGVLLVAVDNDTYPLWYLQQVEGIRRDVVVVSVPLLPATWYRDELRRRDSLLSPESVASWRGTGSTLADLADGARARGRPLAASPTLGARDRARTASDWTLTGFVYVASPESSFDAGRDPAGVAARAPRVDSAAAGEALRWRAANLVEAPPRAGSDPVARQLRALLECPRWALDAGRDEGAARSLDSTCNFR